MKPTNKINDSSILVIFSVLLIMAASFVLLYGLCQQPLGVIPEWSLWIFGHALSAAAVILGLDRHYRHKYESQ